MRRGKERREVRRGEEGGGGGWQGDEVWSERMMGSMLSRMLSTKWGTVSHECLHMTTFTHALSRWRKAECSRTYLRELGSGMFGWYVGTLPMSWRKCLHGTETGRRH